jgi:hypothetical protein
MSCVTRGASYGEKMTPKSPLILLGLSFVSLSVATTVAARTVPSSSAPSTTTAVNRVLTGTC